jgi:hypothetical protein
MAQKNRFLTFLGRQGPEKLESAPEATELEPELLAELSRALQVLEATQGPQGVMNGAQDEVVSLLQTFLTEEAADQRPEILRPGPGATLEARMDEHDILGWAKSFFTWTQGIRKHDWIEAPPEVARIPNTTRVALFGDWGSGLYGAPEIAKMIVATADRYQVVLHLGDTYYSGTESEVKERLLHGWPRVEGAINRTLNGNHEMYSGGKAYFNLALPAFEQKASYFAFENDKWLLVGVDTAYSDHDLYGGQAQWLNGLASRLDGRRLVLFSHHQPFSLLDSQGPKLVKKLSPLLSGKKIFAWYWGHEHHCVLYEKHGSWDLRGRCVGHGGFPYFRETRIFGDQPPSKPELRKVGGRNLVPAARVLDGTNPLIPEAPEKYGPHGYMSLDFDGADLFETLHDSNGDVLYAQPLGEKD